MFYKIENEFLALEAKEQGAELTSIKLKEDNSQYLWQGDPKYWKRHAPVLFPVVGKLKNDKTKINNKTYNMTQHGFARDMNFQVVDKSENSIKFQLDDNEKSIEKYPFKFRLNIEYTLNENRIAIQYIVKNMDDKKMYFSIGAHPAFKCPVLEEETIEDYYLEFEKNEITNSYRLEDGFVSNIPEEFVIDEKINLSHDYFKDGVYIFKELKSQKISLKSLKSKKSVTVEFEGFPYMGIWSVPKNAPFVCVEPWFGITDAVDSIGEFAKKEGIQSLEPGQDLICTHYYIIE